MCCQPSLWERMLRWKQGMMVHSIMMKLISPWCPIVIQAANYGKDVICVVSDDTDASVLLVYWFHRAALVQMKRWNGTVLDCNLYRTLG